MSCTDLLFVTVHLWRNPMSGGFRYLIPWCSLVRHPCCWFCSWACHLFFQACQWLIVLFKSRDKSALPFCPCRSHLGFMKWGRRPRKWRQCERRGRRPCDGKRNVAAQSSQTLVCPVLVASQSKDVCSLLSWALRSVGLRLTICSMEAARKFMSCWIVVIWIRGWI